MKSVKWGIIGPGRIAHNFVNAVNSVENAKVVGCASKNIDRSRNFAEKYNLTSFDSYEDLVKSNEVDAVYIATTHNFHYENMLLCIQNGKHVLCEKAFTINKVQSDKVFEEARINKVFVMEAMWVRFLPAYKWAKMQIDNGAIGSPVLITANLGDQFPFDKDSRAFNINLAGGGVLDIGIYPLSVAAIFFGSEPVEVKSVVHIGETGVDYSGGVSLIYKDGNVASISYTMLANLDNRVVICGTKGKIDINNIFANSGAVMKTDSEEILFNEPYENGFVFQVAEATEKILNGEFESSVMSWHDTSNIMGICDKIRYNAKFYYPEESDI
jgi:dihydrodiol dehydrogenase / D-xylose 1-dehydrogenase (NADP)